MVNGVVVIEGVKVGDAVFVLWGVDVGTAVLVLDGGGEVDCGEGEGVCFCLAEQEVKTMGIMIRNNNESLWSIIDSPFN